MDSAQIIRDAVARVSDLRQQQAGDFALARSVQAVKTFQSHRFAGTYSDLLSGGTFQAAANFFLCELYCDTKLWSSAGPSETSVADSTIFMC